MKRLFGVVVILSIFAIVLGACAAPPAAVPTAAPPTVAPAATTAPTPTPATAGPFSVTHRLGTTTVNAEPQRVVALGVNDIDTAIALGFTPVAINADPFTADGISPWLQGKLDPAKTFILPPSAELPLEKLTELKPDVILATGQYGIDEAYPLLTKIAPTLADINGPDQDSWQEQTLAIGQVLGKEAQAKQLIADTEAQIAAVKSKHPGLAGKTFSLSYAFEPTKVVTLNSPDDFAVKFFESLGLTLAPELTKLANSPTNNTHGELSLEQINLIDADFLMMAYDTPELRAAYEANPLFQKLSAVQKGNYIAVDLPIASEMRYPSVLGIPAVLATLEAPLTKVAGSASAPVAGSGTRTIKDSMGEKTIPANPQRIVALEWTYVEDLLALGVQPVGVADIAGYNDWVKIPVALDASVADVGERSAPNLEALTKLKPDLIIAVAYGMDELYDKLNAIAPTLVFDPYLDDTKFSQYQEMRDTFMTLADATGKQAESEAVLKHMDDKFAASKERIAQAGKSGAQVVLSQAWGLDTGMGMRLFTDNGMAMQIVKQLGLENGWKDGYQQYGFSDASIERLPELGDVHFFYVVQNDDNPFETPSIKPLWDALSFVQAGHVYPLGGDTWLFGGPLSAELLADIVTNALAGPAASE